MKACAIVPAAGQGRRMGQDKALLDLGGRTAVERVADTCAQAGVESVLVVRARGALPLPAMRDAVRTVTVPGDGEMLDSVRAGLDAAGDALDAFLVFPVDHALVAADTCCGLLGRLRQRDARIVLPLYRGRPGHPVAFGGELAQEVRDPATASLRDVVRREPARVAVLPTTNPWVRSDLDQTSDLRAARAALSGMDLPVVEQMHRHRSRRDYLGEPLAPGQLERLVDAARHAGTSSYIQAYSVVAVTDQERKEQVARLCGHQDHIRKAPVFLAVCADAHKLELACRRHGADLQSQSFELFVQATVDAALVGQNLQLAAESEGLGSCMIGAARNHPAELARLLELPRAVYVVFGMVLGKAADDPLPRGRMPLEAVLHRESYDAGILQECLDRADEQMREWARAANAEGKGFGGRPVNEQKGWTDRMATAWGVDSPYLRERRRLRQALEGLGFGLE